MDQITPAAPVPPEEPDSPEQAFEALRGEVAALRRGIEMVHRQGREVQATLPARAAAPIVEAPDYSPTLGQVRKALQTIDARLEAIEGKPALELTPGHLGAEIDRVARATVHEVSRPFQEQTEEARGTVRALKAITGHARSRKEQGESYGSLAFAVPWSGSCFGFSRPASCLGGTGWLRCRPPAATAGRRASR